MEILIASHELDRFGSNKMYMPIDQNVSVFCVHIIKIGYGYK